jgi:cytosine/uracil/thiamine/allantoin permease
VSRGREVEEEKGIEEDVELFVLTWSILVSRSQSISYFIYSLFWSRCVGVYFCDYYSVSRRQQFRDSCES